MNTCISVGVAVSPFMHVTGDGARTVENKEGSIRSAVAAPHQVKSEPSKNNVQTKT